MTDSSTGPGLDDRHHAAHAWARYRRMLLAMAAAGMAIAFAVVGLLWWSSGPLPWIFIGLTVFGVWTTFMMAAALMGLMFLSSGTGHDAHVDDRFSEELLEAHERGEL